MYFNLEPTIEFDEDAQAYSGILCSLRPVDAVELDICASNLLDLGELKQSLDWNLAWSPRIRELRP